VTSRKTFNPIFFFKAICIYICFLVFPSHSQSQSCRYQFVWSPWAPYLEGESKPRGVQIDLLEWISEEINCQFVYKKMIWADSISAIKDGTADIVGRASKTEDRLAFAHFSKSYRENLMVLYVRRGESKNYRGKTLEELFKEGFVLGVARGAFYDKQIAYLKAQPRYAKNFVEIDFIEGAIFQPIVGKEVDGIFETVFAMDFLLLKNAAEQTIEEYPLEIVTDPLYFMFSKKTVPSSFVETFNGALDKVQRSEKYRTHWFWSKLPAPKNP